MVQQVVAKNLFRLRKISGLHQHELAEKAGISRPAYAAIEKGSSDARSDTLHRIAIALNLPISDLFEEMPQLHSLRFRMTKVTEQKRKLREQEIIKAARWLNNYNYLEEILNEKIEYKFSRLKGKDPETLAKKARVELGIDAEEPVYDIVEIFNNAGIKLCFSEMPLDDLFGLSIGEKDGGPAVCVNTASCISIERQIFTGVHEIAHLIMHKDSFNDDLIDDDRKEEKEANIFASYFLMPRSGFKKQLKKYQDLHPVDMVLSIKRIFKVSYRTVLMRLIEENMADRTVYQKFALSYKKLYGGSLKGHFEPEAMSGYNEYAAESEPEGPVKAEMAGNRLYSLVRSAYNKELISLSRAAEILEKTQDEMRELALAWRGELWH